MISLILFALAAILNSFMDKWALAYILLPVSQQNMNNKNWFSFNPVAKWKDGKYNTTKADNYLLLKIGIKTKWLSDNCNDGWHFFKSAMIVLLALSCIAAMIWPRQLLINDSWYSYLLVLGMYGIAWNFPFNEFYNKILNKDN